MTFGSLFAGIGGFDLGFERAGLQCKWQCEIDNDATTILEKHWPDIVRHRDVEDFDCEKREWSVNVVCGGFPCQDLSLCGSMAGGIHGAQSGLFWHIVRVAEEAQADWIVIENVPGLLTGNRGRDFHTLVNHLGQCGFACAWRSFDARYFGVPQRRPRVFIVGHLGEWTGPARVLFEPESLCGDFEQGKAKRNRDAGEIGEGSPYVFSPRIARCKRGLPSAILPTLTSYEESGPHSDSKPHVVTRNGIRRLTAAEHDRAQGFPDGWTEGVSEKARRRLAGNAVVPDIAEWIGRRIRSESA